MPVSSRLLVDNHILLVLLTTRENIVVTVVARWCLCNVAMTLFTIAPPPPPETSPKLIRKKMVMWGLIYGALVICERVASYVHRIEILHPMIRVRVRVG